MPAPAARLAAGYVARAAPDGYTLLTGSPSTNAIAPNLYTNLPYDSLKALVPVSLLVKGPVVLVVNPALGVSTIQELIALYKREPGKHHFATGGNGTHAHLICEWLMEVTGINIVHVPFRGGAPALQAVLAGEPSMIIDNLPTALPHIQAGRVKALAVFSDKRVSALPDVPTMVEAGYKDMVTELVDGPLCAGRDTGRGHRQAERGCRRCRARSPDGRQVHPVERHSRGLDSRRTRRA